MVGVMVMTFMIIAETKDEKIDMRMATGARANIVRQKIET
jgi:hypothetical protein